MCKSQSVFDRCSSVLEIGERSECDPRDPRNILWRNTVAEWLSSKSLSTGQDRALQCSDRKRSTGRWDFNERLGAVALFT